MGYEVVVLMLIIVVAVLAFFWIVPRRLRSWSTMTKPADEDIEWSAHLQSDQSLPADEGDGAPERARPRAATPRETGHMRS